MNRPASPEPGGDQSARRFRRALAKRAAWGVFSILLLASGAWLVIDGRLIQRVYYYRDRDALHELGAAPDVRRVLWSAPREIPEHSERRAPPDLPLPGPQAHVSKGALLVSLRTPGGDFDIHIRELTAEGWSAPVPLDGGYRGGHGAERIDGAVNTPHDEITPALSPRGDVVYFASDRPGGNGGYDLYSSRRSGSGWEKPVNLGPRINSPFDDTGPAPHPREEEILAFSTNRPKSFIFAPPAEWADIILPSWKKADDEIAFAVHVRHGAQGMRWSIPHPLVEIGSPSNERDPCFSAQGDFLYFSSDRPGGLGGLDLHRARALTFGQGVEETGELVADSPVNLGPPLNSAHDDRSPKLFLEGFALAYQVSKSGRPEELLLESRSREVDSELEIASVPLRVFAENIARLGVLAAGGAALAVMGVLLFRYRQVWRLSLLGRCAMASVAFHVLMLYGFCFWIVSEDIVAIAEKQAEAEVTVERMLQAKITVEAARMDVRVPDGVLPDAPPPAAAEPAEKAARLALEKVIGNPDEALPAIQASASSHAPGDLASAVIPRLESAEPANEAAKLPPARPAPAAALAPAAGALPLPDRRAPAPEGLGDAPAMAAAAAKADGILPDPLPPLPGPPETAAPRPPGGTAPGAPGTSAVELAATQIAAPVTEIGILPPVARPPPRTAGLTAPLPVPDQAEVAARETRAMAAEVSPRPSPGRTSAKGSATASSTPQVKTTEAPGALAHWRSPQPRITPSLTPIAEAREIPSSSFVPDTPAPPVPGSPRRLPESLPRAEVASPVERSPGAAPRPAERLAPASSPRAGRAAAEVPSPVTVFEARPLAAEADSFAPVTAAASAALAPEPRPGLAPGAAFLEAGPPPLEAAVTLPEKTATRPAEGGATVADIFGPRSTASRAAGSAGSGAVAGASLPLETIRTAPAGAPGPRPLEAGGAPGAVPPPLSASAAGGRILFRPGQDPEAPPEALSPPIARRRQGEGAEVAAVLPEAPPALRGETDLRKIRSPGVRKVLVDKMGGSGGSEDAVRRALDWLARHQARDGRWDIDGFDAACQGCRSPGYQVSCDSAVTGLAILCYLGQNHSPAQAESPFRRNVSDALDWLIAGQAPNGSLAREDQRYTMYSHGIATLALSEAYTLTKNKRYLEPLRRATRLIVRAQNPTTGGWRYRPSPPLRGDTSITGWQVLALTSARGAGIEVPEASFDGARHWLDVEVSGGSHGGIYGYTRPDEPRLAMVAEGMFARQLLGGRRTDRNIEEAARYIHSETRSGGYLDNLYLLYYGNLALYHYQGWIWERWNREVREFLVRTQHQTGPLGGSWDPNGPWSEAGGRVLSTCFATLTLEVYYRYLPLYWKADQAQARGE